MTKNFTPFFAEWDRARGRLVALPAAERPEVIAWAADAHQAAVRAGCDVGVLDADMDELDLDYKEALKAELARRAMTA